LNYSIQTFVISCIWDTEVLQTTNRWQKPSLHNVRLHVTWDKRYNMALFSILSQYLTRTALCYTVCLSLTEVKSSRHLCPPEVNSAGHFLGDRAWTSMLVVPFLRRRYLYCC